MAKIFSASVVERRERFVIAFLSCGNATQAYRQAGYAPQYADRGAARLMKDPGVQARLAELRGQIHQDDILSIEQQLRRLTKIALTDITDPDQHTIMVAHKLIADIRGDGGDGRGHDSEVRAQDAREKLLRALGLKSGIERKLLKEGEAQP